MQGHVLWGQYKVDENYNIAIYVIMLTLSLTVPKTDGRTDGGRRYRRTTRRRLIQGCAVHMLIPCIVYNVIVLAVFGVSTW